MPSTVKTPLCFTMSQSAAFYKNSDKTEKSNFGPLEIDNLTLAFPLAYIKFLYFQKPTIFSYFYLSNVSSFQVFSAFCVDDSDDDIYNV